MSKIPDHIHALPRVDKNIVLPEAVAAWDDENKKLYIGDGVTKGGVEFITAPNCIRVKYCTGNKINVQNGYIPVMIKTNTNKFYTIRGEDLSLSGNGIVIDISNALALNNLSSFQGEWTVYFGGKID